jgi:hypothetical protein
MNPLKSRIKIHIQTLNYGFGFKSGSVIATDPHLLGKSVFYTLLPPPTQSFFTSIEGCFYDCKYKKKQNILRGGRLYFKDFSSIY